MITIEQFTQQSGFSDRDSFAACKMYAGQMKTSAEWNEILKKDFSFTLLVENVSVENTDESSNQKSKKNK